MVLEFSSGHVDVEILLGTLAHMLKRPLDTSCCPGEESGISCPKNRGYGKTSRVKATPHGHPSVRRSGRREPIKKPEKEQSVSQVKRNSRKHGCPKAKWRNGGKEAVTNSIKCC